MNNTERTMTAGLVTSPPEPMLRVEPREQEPVRLLSSRSVRWGTVGAAAMLAFYVGVVAVASGWRHLIDQIALDWYFVVPIVAGFGVQVAVMTELRHRHRMRAVEATAGGAGAGSSTAGMLACCAHHLTDLAPLAGATGAVAFLADYRVPFMVAGLALNAAGLTVGIRRLLEQRGRGALPAQKGGERCAA